MPIPVAVPRLGWSMDEGTFLEWLKADGDAVRPGDVLFLLVGEKATEEVESLDAGVLHIPPGGPKPGEKVKVGQAIAVLLQPGELAPTSPGRPKPEPAASPSALPRDPAPPAAVAVTPRARGLARKLGIDTATLRGTGRNGRVRERDIPLPPPAPTPNLVPHTPVRRTIAARMVESLRTAAPVTLTSAVDATNLVNLRAQFKAAGAGTVPSYNDFLLKFVAAGLGRHPALGARWTAAGLAFPERIDIGLAVDTDAGLMVPVVRDVPALGLSAVAARTRDLVARARAGTLSAADVRGGCFTVTNLGAFGVDAFTPIINPPECAILVVGRIERRPVAGGDRIVIRPQLTLNLTFDHRVVDGAPAARFLQAVAECVRNPAPWVSS